MTLPQFGRFLAFSAIGTVALMPLLVLPAMIGVLVDNAAMSDASAGASASLHFLAGATVGLVTALRIHHLNLRRVTALALLAAIVCDVTSGITAGDNQLFFAARAAAGMGLGVAYVAAASAFARYDDFERGYGLFITMQFIVSGLGLYIVPVYADELGTTGLFFGFVILELLALLMSVALPGLQSAPSQGVANDVEGQVSELGNLLTATAIFAVLGFAIFEAANNAQFTYIERFGVALDIADADIGFSLFIASLAGIPGAFAIVIVGCRFGTLLPLLLGIGLGIAGMLILIGAETYAVYFIGSCCMGFSWAFCLPFIQTLLATIDRKGSVIAAGSSISTFGSAAGPGIAALIVTGGNYANVFRLSILFFVLSAVLFVYAARHRRDS